MKIDRLRIGSWLAMALLTLIAATGCTTYEVGSALPPDIETIHVPPVLNQTGEPLLESEVTRALLRELQRDGTLRMTDAESADARLDVSLVKFETAPVRYERDDTKTATEYRMLIAAQVRLTRKNEAEPMMQRVMHGDTTFTFFGDMASSKNTATPLAARDLAHDIVESMVEYW